MNPPHPQILYIVGKIAGAHSCLYIFINITLFTRLADACGLEYDRNHLTRNQNRYQEVWNSVNQEPKAVPRSWKSVNQEPKPKPGTEPGTSGLIYWFDQEVIG